MEATLVRSGILPPIIKTTPNSPTVWANDNTIPVSREGLMFGSSTLKSVVRYDFPITLEASSNDEGKLVNPLWMGCTIKGKEYMTEAITSPGKENAMIYIQMAMLNLLVYLKLHSTVWTVKQLGYLDIDHCQNLFR